VCVCWPLDFTFGRHSVLGKVEKGGEKRGRYLQCVRFAMWKCDVGATASSRQQVESGEWKCGKGSGKGGGAGGKWGTSGCGLTLFNAL